MLRRALLAAGGVAVLAGCGWMFADDRDVPDSVRELFAEMAVPGGAGQDCEVLLDRIRKVATAPDPHGGEHEFAWFIAATDSGGQFDFVFQLDDDGESVGGAGGGGGCKPVPEPDDEITWSGGGDSDREVSHGGRVPSGSATVRLFFEGHEEPAVVEVQGEGYYFTVLGESACCEFSFPEKFEALDADGAVIASTRPP